MKYQKNRGKIWIVGGDSKIGSSLSKELRRQGLPFVSTSRKKKKRFFYLDLSKKIPKIPIIQQDKIIILAGITNMAECEKNKNLCKKVNYKSQKNLIDQARKKKCFLVYLSSSRVFSGKRKTPSENTIPKPLNFYGKLKYKTELYIKKKHPNSAILRLSKVIDTNDLKKKNLLPINQIFKSDKIFIAPIPLNRVVPILIKILIKEKTGVFHLSSKNKVSNFKFYQYFNKKILIKNDPETKNLWEKNPVLSMKNTVKNLKIKQETWQEMFT